MTRSLSLREWTTTEATLEPDEVLELQRLPAKLTIQPLGGRRYTITPQSMIGAASTSSLDVVIRPKLSVERIFELINFSPRFPLLDSPAALERSPSIVEPFAAAFVASVRRAFRQGVLLGCVRREEALPLIRGRIRFADQIRRRTGLPLPIELLYDDYTVDIEENRLLKAALRRLQRLRYRNERIRPAIAANLAALEGVTDWRYDRRRLPEVQLTRLARRYEQPLAMANLILRNTSVDLAPGSQSSTGFFINMDDVFEDFVFAVVGRELRRELSPEYTWRQGFSVALDIDGRVRPKPDLLLRHRKRAVWVGDAKYKTTTVGESDDLYQLLAYCAATGLDEGTLIYAEQPAGPATLQVVHGGPLLRVEAIDLTSPMDAIVRRCGDIATRIAEVVNHVRHRAA